MEILPFVPALLHMFSQVTLIVCNLCAVCFCQLLSLSRSCQTSHEAKGSATRRYWTHVLSLVGFFLLLINRFIIHESRCNVYDNAQMHDKRVCTPSTKILSFPENNKGKGWHWYVNGFQEQIIVKREYFSAISSKIQRKSFNIKAYSLEYLLKRTRFFASWARNQFQFRIIYCYSIRFNYSENTQLFLL